MTAVVGILNKQAVAIAADSAVTIGGSNGRKIFNRANKVFTLSKHHPVGIMIYNSATFMNTPWETIIKVYRKNLKDKSFATVKEYQEDFISFLKQNNCYVSDEDKSVFLFNFLDVLTKSIINDVANLNEALVKDPTDENKLKILNLLESKIEEYIQKINTNSNYCSEFLDFTKEEFEKLISTNFENLINENFTKHGYVNSYELKEKWKQFFYLYLKLKETHTNFTGLIFTGFGEEELYPSLIPLNISFSVGNRIRYYIEEEKAAVITNNNDGAICPFAQTDVIDTILTGIDPRLDEIYLKNFEVYFSKYNEEILTIIADTNPEASALIKGLDIGELVTKYSEKNLETKRSNYIFPLMNAVSSLSKEDLAEMAESLIYLTYLKRRITFAEESVGGPVDVAIISKGDGFIWIKRKHYFKPELNQYFFDNYLKN